MLLNFFSHHKISIFHCFFYFGYFVYLDSSLHTEGMLKLNALGLSAQIMSLDEHNLAILISFTQTRLHFSFQNDVLLHFVQSTAYFFDVRKQRVNIQRRT